MNLRTIERISFNRSFANGSILTESPKSVMLYKKDTKPYYEKAFSYLGTQSKQSKKKEDDL